MPITKSISYPLISLNILWVLILSLALPITLISQEEDAGGIEINIGGFNRNFFTVSKTFDFPPLLQGEDYFNDSNRFRLEFEARFTKNANFNLQYDIESLAGTLTETQQFKLTKNFETQNLFDLDDTIIDADNFFLRHSLYRIYLTYYSQVVDITVGRQRIPWGTGRVFNPTDLFNPYDPLVIESGERTGVDAVNLDYHLTSFNKLNFVFAARDRLDQSNFGLRYTTLIGSYDISIVAAKFKQGFTDLDLSTFEAITTGSMNKNNIRNSHIESIRSGFDDPSLRPPRLATAGLTKGRVGWGCLEECEQYFRVSSKLNENQIPLATQFRDSKFIGFDFSGNLKGAGLRSEVTFTFVEDNTNFLRGVLSLDYQFANGVYVLSEYFFNGQGKSDKQDYEILRAVGGDIQYLAKNYFFFGLAKDITPLVTIQHNLIFNFNDRSYFSNPTIRYSYKTNIDLTGGVLLFQGDRLSELGAPANAYFLQMEYYF